MNTGIVVGGLLVLAACGAFRRAVKCNRRGHMADSVWWSLVGLFLTGLTLVYGAGYGVALLDK